MVGIKKRVIWKKIDDTQLDNYPESTEDELRDLTMGIYQPKQAKSYTDEQSYENWIIPDNGTQRR